MNRGQNSSRNRPYVIINCAMSIDGKIALPSKKPVKLSSLEDFKRVHQLRNYCDAILVGVNTIIMDNPKLTVKPEFVMKPKNPIRVVLDSQGRTPEHAYVVDGIAPTIIVIGDRYKDKKKSFKNAEVIYCPMSNTKEINLLELLKILKERRIENLLVEGGETVIFNFINHKLFDELNIYISSKIIGGINTPTLAGGDGITNEDEIIKLRLYSYDQLGDGVLLKYLAK